MTNEQLAAARRVQGRFPAALIRPESGAVASRLVARRVDGSGEAATLSVPKAMSGAELERSLTALLRQAGMGS